MDKPRKDSIVQAFRPAKRSLTEQEFALAATRIYSATYMLEYELVALMANYKNGLLKQTALKGHFNNLKAASKNINTWFTGNLVSSDAKEFIEGCKDNGEGVQILFDALIACPPEYKQEFLNELVKLAEKFSYKPQSQDHENI